MRVQADEEQDDRPLLVTDAVLIIMLIEISTAAKIDAAALRVSTLEFRTPRITRPSFRSTVCYAIPIASYGSPLRH